MTVQVPVSDPPLGCITRDSEDGIGVLRLRGDIDCDAVAAYERRQTPPDGPSITVVDLSAVTFLSSSGVAFLIRQTQASRDLGQLPTLRGVTGRARRILTMTGTGRLFRPGD